MYHKWMTVCNCKLHSPSPQKGCWEWDCQRRTHWRSELPAGWACSRTCPPGQNLNFFCSIFVEKMCRWSHIPYQSDRPKRGEWNAVSCATLQWVLQKRQKIPRKNYITKLICRTPFCRIPSVERSKWDLILFHHHSIIVTSYITVNKNLPQCRLNRQPDAAKTGCPPLPPHTLRMLVNWGNSCAKKPVKMPA